MHKAVEGGQLQVVEMLLSKGAEVDSKDKVSALLQLCNISFFVHSVVVIMKHDNGL